VPPAAGTPAPVSATVWGLDDALSVIVTDPVRTLAAVGLNVTVTVQLAPAATEPPHELVWAKSPDAVMLVIASAAPPLLVSVNVCGALVVCTA
jgi:hypothetical protein